MFEIVRSKIETDRITDFVAIGNLIDDKAVSYHAAFIIKCENILYEFHYTGSSIELIQLQRDYFHKITDTISPEEVPAFMALCKNIQKKANPIYDFYYSGESYDIDGNHISNPESGERMTCVGFCLNVLKGFLDEDYLVYSDWTSETNQLKEYLEYFCRNNNIAPIKITSSHRRITPRECLTSCFFKDIPITKQRIDERIGKVDDFFLTRYSISNN